MNQKLNTAIKKSGLYKKEFAEKIGISRAYLYDIIKEKYKPSKEIEDKILELLEKKFEELF